MAPHHQGGLLSKCTLQSDLLQVSAALNALARHKCKKVVLRQMLATLRATGQ